LAWNAPDQQGPVDVAKAVIQICRRQDGFEQRKCAIVQFHNHSLECTQDSWNLNQMKAQRLIGPEHLPGSNTKQKRVTNQSGGTCDSDFNRSFHVAISHKQLAEKSRSVRLQLVINYDLSMYPTKLNKIINLFESLPEDERRETLVSYADNAKK